MKRIMLCVVVLLWSAVAICQTYNGPFGLKMGLTYQQVKAIDSDIEAVESVGHAYVIEDVPKPHSRFESYILFISPKTGLCKIVAIGKNVSTNGSGYALRTEYQSVRDAIINKYGQNKEYDFLSNGSIWNEPRDFMMALVKEDRYLLSTWLGEDGDLFYDNISAILLEARAQDSSTGYLRLGYEFENFSSFSDECKSIEDSAF